jgi:hypothetical protein
VSILSRVSRMILSLSRRESSRILQQMMAALCIKHIVKDIGSEHQKSRIVVLR